MWSYLNARVLYGAMVSLWMGSLRAGVNQHLVEARQTHELLSALAGTHPDEAYNSF